jgi:adenosine deaminase
MTIGSALSMHKVIAVESIARRPRLRTSRYVTSSIRVASGFVRRWLEIQVDPSGYAARFGGITAFTDLVLDAVAAASRDTGLGMAVVIAANRTRHPLDARTLARLAAQYAGRGVVGFGLSNDERRGSTAEFDAAFRIAGRAGLRLVPHGGELRGPDHIRVCLDALAADRLGHGVRSVEDPALLARIVDSGIPLEVCPV